MVPAALLRPPFKRAAPRSAILHNWKPIVLSDESASSAGGLLSFADFRRRIPRALAQQKEFGFGGGLAEDPVMKIFHQLDTASTNRKLAMYAHKDPALRYTRNLIDTDNETYTLLLLCWNPGHESPIHDHPGDGCWVKVMDGVIRESRYHEQHHQTLESPNDTRLRCYQSTTAGKGQVMYMDDSRGYHKVGNPGSRIATTLHLYSPPIHKCKTWSNEFDGAPKESTVSNYSEFGYKL